MEAAIQRQIQQEAQIEGIARQLQPVGNLTKSNLERAQRIHANAARSLELPKSLTPKVLKEARFGAEGNENFVLWRQMWDTLTQACTSINRHRALLIAHQDDVIMATTLQTVQKSAAYIACDSNTPVGLDERYDMLIKALDNVQRGQLGVQKLMCTRNPAAMSKHKK